jgi:deazaflavin-dependent oxidoreductase (nitroreductase family)
MTTSDAEYRERNLTVVGTFRANNGRMPNNAPLLLLTTKGAHSGQTRLSPLAYSRDGDRLVIIASKGGNPKHPDWYHNVVANAEVTVEVGGEQFHARARVIEGAERQRLFDAQAAVMPNFAEYQERTSRQIPVIVLEWM